MPEINSIKHLRNNTSLSVNEIAKIHNDEAHNILFAQKVKQNDFKINDALLLDGLVEKKAGSKITIEKMFVDHIIPAMKEFIVIIEE